MLFSGLPVELQNGVLKSLNGVSLARAGCVCRTWHELLSAETYNQIWRQECLSDIDKDVLVEITGIENILFCQPNISKRFPGTTHVWKTIYKTWYISRKVGKWPVMKREVQAHNVGICDIQIFGELIYSASVDGVIKSWDSWTGTCLDVLCTSHHSPVTTIALFPSSVQLFTDHPHRPTFLLCGSEDHTISIWDLETGSSKGILCGHNHAVTCVIVYKHFVVSSSFDQTIKLWDLKKNPQSACIKTLRGHNAPITSLSVWKMNALSVSRNAIKLWSLESGECLHTLEDAHYVREYITEDCVLRGRYALVLTNNGEIKLCDFSKLGISSNNYEVCSNYQLLNYSTTECSRLSCLAVHGNLMAVSSNSGLVYLFHYQKDWSEKVSDILFKVKCGHPSMACIRLSCDNEGPLLVTSSSDGVIQLFRWFSPSLD